MTRFETGKIKGHYRNSTGHREAVRDDNQTEYSENDCAQPPTPPPAEPPQCKKRGCPNSNVPRESGENIYVLRNCNECHDYTVRPCRKCNCPLRRQSVENPQPQSQDKAHSSEDSRLTQPSTSKPEERPKINRRRSGGSCKDQVCQLCGQYDIAEATPPGGYEGMCIQCNSKIQSAMNTYYAQQAQGQPPWPNYQPAQPYVYQQAPMPNQWHNQVPSTVDPTKEAPFNIIVLQDCHNNNALIDQLTNAISRIGTNTSQGPRLSNGFNGHGYGNGGLIDYQYLNYNDQPPAPPPQDMYTRRSYQYDDNYNDFQYAQNPIYQRPYNENPNKNQNLPKLENINDEYQNDAPLKDGSQQETCNLNSCPLKTNEPPSDSNGCSCDCGYCRKGFETKEKLAELIAQALEIFIMGTKAKSKPDHEKDTHRKEAKPKIRQARAGARISKAKPKVVPIARSRSSSRENTRLVSRDGSKISSKMASIISNASLKENLPKKSSKIFESVKSFEKRPTKERRSKRNRKVTQGRVNYRGGGGGGSVNELPDFLKRSNRDLLGSNKGSKTFFLPNCAKNQCKSGCGGRCAKPPHNCNSGCKGCCRAACSKSNTGTGGVGGADGGGGGADGDGDNRTRPISSRHARCFQCNSGKPGHRQWHEYDADSCPMRQKDGGGGGGKGRCCGGAGYMGKRLGGKSPSICAVTGLSRIAHYRPGMLNFPVNYIIDGIHSKRSSLVRTAAGVTLQQGPFLMTATHAPHLPRIPMQPNANETKKQRRKWL